MGTYKVGSDGNAPAGLKAGDRIVTNAGMYEIVPSNVSGANYNPNTGYYSVLVDKNINVNNYGGEWSTAPTAQQYAQQNSPATELWQQQEVELPKYEAPDTSDLERQIAELTEQIANNQYTPVDPTQYTKDIMTYEEAVELARQALEPQYVSVYQQAADAAAQNLDRAGIYNSMYGQALSQQAQNDVAADMNANISALALDMQGQDREYAMQLLQNAINENQFGANFTQGNLSAAAQLTMSYLDSVVQQANSINDYNLSLASLQLQKNAQALEEAYTRGQISQMELENQLLALEMEAQGIENQILEQEVSKVSTGGGGGDGGPSPEPTLEEWGIANATDETGKDWIMISGMGRVSFQELDKLIENGKVEAVEGSNNKVIYRMVR